LCALHGYSNALVVLLKGFKEVEGVGVPSALLEDAMVRRGGREGGEAASSVCFTRVFKRVDLIVGGTERRRGSGGSSGSGGGCDGEEGEREGGKEGVNPRWQEELHVLTFLHCLPPPLPPSLPPSLPPVTGRGQTTNKPAVLALHEEMCGHVRAGRVEHSLR